MWGSNVMTCWGELLSSLFFPHCCALSGYITGFHRTVGWFLLLHPSWLIPAWPTSTMHEPLTLGVYLPLMHFSLCWDWKQQVKFQVSFCVLLCQHGARHVTHQQEIFCMHEFWSASSWVARVPECLVCNLLLHPSWRLFLDILRNCDEDRNDTTLVWWLQVRRLTMFQHALMIISFVPLSVIAEQYYMFSPGAGIPHLLHPPISEVKLILLDLYVTNYVDM